MSSEEHLVEWLRQRGHLAVWRPPWVLTIVAGRKLAVRVRSYESRTDPAYLEAATRAAAAGHIGAGRLVTLDESRGGVRFYTVHVAPGRPGYRKMALRISNR